MVDQGTTRAAVTAQFRSHSLITLLVYPSISRSNHLKMGNVRFEITLKGYTYICTDTSLPKMQTDLEMQALFKFYNQ